MVVKGIANILEFGCFKTFYDCIIFEWPSMRAPNGPDKGELLRLASRCRRIPLA